MVTADASDAACAQPLREAQAEARRRRWSAEALQAEFLGDVHRCVSRRLPRREDAEDVTAEVFAAAFQALPRFRGQCDPRLWLLGIARRKIADALRRKQRHRETLTSEQTDAPLDTPSTAVEPETAAQDAEDARILRGLIAGLKPDWRDALLLRYADGLSLEEVAVVMRRSPGAMNSLMQRARAAVYRAGKAHFVGVEEEGR